MRPVSFLIVAGFLAAAHLARGQEAQPLSPRPAALPATGRAAMDPPVSPWEFSPVVRTSVGWRDNATVTPYDEVDLSFWRAEAELMLVRPFGDTFQFISFVNGDVLRYFSPPRDVPGEQLWLAHLEGRWQPLRWLRPALKSVGFQQDAYIDPSETEGAQDSARWVRFQGAYATLTSRVTCPGGWTLEPWFQVKRIDYRRGYTGDHDETTPGVRLEWRRAEAIRLFGTFAERHRRYSTLTPYRASGRPEDRGHLRLRQREGSLGATTQFSVGGTWSITAAVGRLENRDRAAGYLDYDQKSARLDLQWQGKRWLVTLNGDARRLDYRTQKVGRGIVRPARLTDAYELTARIERELRPRWTAFVEDRWERSRSNLDNQEPGYLYSYRTQLVLAGIEYAY